MITAEVWAEVRRLRLMEHLRIADIAAKLSLHRNTVRNALRSRTYQPHPNRPLQPSMLEPFKPFLQERLKEFPSLTATRLLADLRGRGYQGGVTILKDYLATLRPPKTTAYLTLTFPPAQAAQVDWANCGVINVGRATRRLSCFAMVLCYSRMLYLEFTLSETIEEFLRCHVNAFQFFGGFTTELIYDNLKSVVLQRFDKAIRFNPRFMAFAGYYAFKPVLCRQRSPQEKGRVENAVSYIRKSFLAGSTFAGFEQINPAAVAWRDTVANVRLHGTTHAKPIDRFAEEHHLLVPLPARPCDVLQPVPVQATSTFRVRFEANAYSVPPRYAGQALTLKATPTEILVYDREHLVASHPRSFDKYGDFEKPEHVKALLASRQRGHREHLVAEFLSLGGPAEAYYNGLVHAQLNLYLQLTRILNLANTYGRPAVLAAIRQALPFQAFGAHYLENLIHQERQRQALPPHQPLRLPNDPQIQEASLPEVSLDHFDSLGKEKITHESP